MGDELDVGVATDLLGDSDVQDVLADVGDFFIDTPVVGEALRVMRAVNNVPNILWKRKLRRFMETGFEEKEGAKEAWKLLDPRTRERVGEHVLNVLSQLDDVEKAGLMAAILEEWLLNRIELGTAKRLWRAVSVAALEDLRALALARSKTVEPDHFRRLASTGLVDYMIPRAGVMSSVHGELPDRPPNMKLTADATLLEPILQRQWGY